MDYNFDFNKLNSDAYNNTTGLPKKGNAQSVIVLDYLKLENDTRSFFNDGKGIQKFKFEPDGEYVFSFLPFPLGNNHPRGKELQAQGIPMDWKLNLFLHTVVTDRGSMKFVCPYKTFGKQCAYCETKRDLFNKYGDWKSMSAEQRDDIKQYNDTERNYFFVLNHDDGKVYVMEYSSYFFWDNLQKKLARTNATEAKVSLPHPGTNKHALHFWVDQGNLKDNKGNPVIGEVKEMEFTNREDAIPQDIIDNLPALADYIKLYSYDEVSSFVDGTFFTEQDEDVVEAPVAKENPFPQISTPVEQETPSRRMRSVPEGTTGISVGPSIGDTTQSIGRKESSSLFEASPHTEETASMDREARRKARLAKNQSSDPNCPVSGGIFGESTDSFDECEECPVYEACSAKFDSNH